MSDKQEFDDDVAGYRQPMVTSIGIMFGFELAFLANWAVHEDESSALIDATDWIVALTLIASLSLMAIVLFRLLDNRIRPTPAGERYQATFKLYITSIVLSFLGLGAGLIA